MSNEETVHSHARTLDDSPASSGTLEAVDSPMHARTLHDGTPFHPPTGESRLVAMLKKHEGLRLDLYKCTSGKLTIGYGYNIEDNGIPLYIAEELFNYSFALGCDAAIKAVPQFNELCKARQDVLINMGFNLGLTRLLRFKKMRAAVPRAIETGDFNEVADEMLDSRWAQQVGERAVTLSDMMRTGEWADE